MRDPNRIPVILDELKEYWIRYPDLRLGQIISNFGSYAGLGNDPFFMEDDVLLRLIWDENMRAGEEIGSDNKQRKNRPSDPDPDA